MFCYQIKERVVQVKREIAPNRKRVACSLKQRKKKRSKISWKLTDPSEPYSTGVDCSARPFWSCGNRLRELSCKMPYLRGAKILRMTGLLGASVEKTMYVNFCIKAIFTLIMIIIFWYFKEWTQIIHFFCFFVIQFTLNYLKPRTNIWPTSSYELIIGPPVE